MEFKSILGFQTIHEDVLKVTSAPRAFTDLNLSQMIGEMSPGDFSLDIRKYFYILPATKEDVIFRQGVVKDLDQPSLFQAVQDYSKHMNKTREYCENARHSPNDLQKACWVLDGILEYDRALQLLCDALRETAPHEQGFSLLFAWLERELSSKEAIERTASAKKLREKLSNIRVTIRLKDDKIFVEKVVSEDNLIAKVDQLAKDKGDKPFYCKEPFGGGRDLSYFELDLLQRIESRNPEEFKEIHAFYKKYKEFVDPMMTQLEMELSLYISYQKYISLLERKGFSFVLPTLTEQKIDIKQCYDMILAKKNEEQDLPVVCNDITFREGEDFFVITGPNQGGKTTFARALGQIVYLARMGLKVPAKAASIPMFENVATHFATEESAETGAGKLKEELLRLSPMMKDEMENHFVIINELFTTAATYDAYIMGNRVMKHFRENHCKGIYVTHIKELATEGDGIVSLVATVDKEDSHIRTFCMKRMAPEGIGYARDITEKYHLTYEELKRRLNG